jgi:hypothetical protein
MKEKRVHLSKEVSRMSKISEELRNLEDSISGLMKKETSIVRQSKLVELESRVDLLIESCENEEEVDNEDNMKMGMFAIELLASLSVLRVRNKKLSLAKWLETHKM